MRHCVQPPPDEVDVGLVAVVDGGVERHPDHVRAAERLGRIGRERQTPRRHFGADQLRKPRLVQRRLGGAQVGDDPLVRVQPNHAVPRRRDARRRDAAEVP